jgi:hypothetical protein
MGMHGTRTPAEGLYPLPNLDRGEASKQASKPRCAAIESAVRGTEAT